MMFNNSRQQQRISAVLLGVMVLCLFVPLFVLAGRMTISAHALADRGAAELALTGELDHLLQRHRTVVMQKLRNADEAQRAVAMDELSRVSAELTGRLPALAQVIESGESDESSDMAAMMASMRMVANGMVQRDQSFPPMLNELAVDRYDASYTSASNAVRFWLAGLAGTMRGQMVLLSAGSAIVALWAVASAVALVVVAASLMSSGQKTERRLRRIRARILQIALLDSAVEPIPKKKKDEINLLWEASTSVARFVKDVTAQNIHLQTVNARCEAALSHVSQGICLFDAVGNVEVFNLHLCKIFRFNDGDLYCGMAFAEFTQKIVEAGGFSDFDFDRLTLEQQASIERREAGSELALCSDGRMISVVHWPLADGGYAATFDDVTDRRAADAQIAYMARHDALTGLPNRLVLQERIEQELIETGRGSRSAVLFLDIDHFKRVNDALGHPIGDGLLRAVSDRLLACVREGDTVARLGGDEFAIVQAGIARPEDAKLLAERIMTTLAPPFVVEGHPIAVGASIGLALMPEDGTDAATLLKNADMALYRAKHDERGTFSFFEAEMDSRLQLRRQLETDLRTGLVDQAFELYYQPMVNPVTEQVIGFEALLRWRHPTRGMVSPAEFIPIAEEIGLIVPLGEWVIRTACLEAVRWPGKIKVALNLSPIQFRSRNLVAAVASSLQESGLAASRLELEVTETLLLQESEATISLLHELRALGAQISMDDFGTGYSSLSYLRSFPFDKIKIDQSFIRDLSKREDAIHIVRAIRGLCAGLGMNTTAEGVETEEQFAKIRSEGCTEAQGYLFSPPRPAADVLSVIRQVEARNACCTPLLETGGPEMSDRV